MTALAWGKETVQRQAALPELQRLAMRLRPFAQEAAAEDTEQARRHMIQALPVVAETVEALKYHRKQTEQWYWATFAYAREMQMPEVEELFHMVEEAETLALVFGQAFVDRMFREPALGRWEDVQSLQTLLQHMVKALDEWIALERELPAPVDA